jgi:hypothetical protein
MPRTMKPWHFDPSRQILHTPSGRSITVREIAQLLADRRDCRYDFHGEWSGWKMRRQFLIPPHTGPNGPKLRPETAKLFAQWVNEPARELGLPLSGPRLRLVYSR